MVKEKYGALSTFNKEEFSLVGNGGSLVRKGFFEVYWNRDLNDGKEPCTDPRDC